MVKLKKMEKIELEEFLRGMVEAFNRRLNRIENNLNEKFKRQGEIINKLERNISAISRKVSFTAKLKVDKSLLKDLDLPLEVIKPTEKVSKPKEQTKGKKTP